MIATSDLRAIAKARLRDAQVLLRAKRFDGAFYLCGYSVELALKSRICRTLKWSGFPQTGQEFSGLQSVKSHDLEVLLRFSGIEDRIKRKCLSEWSVVLDWNTRQAVSVHRSVHAAAGHRHANIRQKAPSSHMIAVSSLRKAMHEIAAKKGDFTLFGLFMRSDAPGTWDLVVSAPWLEEGKLKATNEFAKLLADSIGEHALRNFSRIQTVGSDNPALESILTAFSVDDGEVRIQKSNLFGLEIEDAIILRAKKPQPGALPDSALHPSAGGSSGGRR